MVDEYVNKETGEIRQGIFIEKRRVKKSFIMLFQDASIAMSKDMGMTEAAFRVYHWLCGKANHHCIVRASQGEMAEDIGISRSAVNKAVKYMSSAGYLVQIATLGYELNSNIVRRGVDK
jgi:DNA-binding MarR family transcriptional regulator